MDTEETKPGPLPAWLDPDTEGAPTEALRMIYQQLPREVVQACERARSGMREGYVTNLLAAHDALAPYGCFKQWCQGAGINYETARSIVKRAGQAKRPKPEPKSEQATGGETNPRPVASDEDDEDESEDDEEDDESEDDESEDDESEEEEEEEKPEEDEEDKPEPNPKPEPKPKREPKREGKRQLVITLESDVERNDVIAWLHDVGDHNGLARNDLREAVLFLQTRYIEQRAARQAERATGEAA